ncbi:hypothetical protein BDZ91DRAFT_737853, partial [Kalaharituber pfeilii]
REKKKKKKKKARVRGILASASHTIAFSCHFYLYLLGAQYIVKFRMFIIH